MDEDAITAAALEAVLGVDEGTADLGGDRGGRPVCGCPVGGPGPGPRSRPATARDEKPWRAHGYTRVGNRGVRTLERAHSQGSGYPWTAEGGTGCVPPHAGAVLVGRPDRRRCLFTVRPRVRFQPRQPGEGEP